MRGGVVDTSSMLRERIFQPLPRNPNKEEQNALWNMQMHSHEDNEKNVFSLQEIVQLHDD
jgi:hypothetical protein